MSTSPHGTARVLEGSEHAVATRSDVPSDDRGRHDAGALPGRAGAWPVRVPAVDRPLLAAVSRTTSEVPPSARRSREKHRARAAHLYDALTSGDVTTSDTIMQLLVAQSGVHAAHRVLADLLAEHQDSDDPGRAAVGRIAFSTARTVLERMRSALASPVPATAALVLLATPEGDRHTLALLTLSLELEKQGFRTMVLDELPPEVIGHVVAATAATAVVISAHVRISAKRARELIGACRRVRPGTVVVMGGPGISPALRGADLVTDDATEVARLLSSRDAVLTEREREVLLMVADGLTNSEIAERLCLSPATVKTHLDHVFAKTNTVHRAAAVAYALRRGWIS